MDEGALGPPAEDCCVESVATFVDPDVSLRYAMRTGTGVPWG
jgi:hypothetical protein